MAFTQHSSGSVRRFGPPSWRNNRPHLSRATPNGAAYEPFVGLADFEMLVDQTGRYSNLLDQIGRLLKEPD
jgi:hypothetical protein